MFDKVLVKFGGRAREFVLGELDLANPSNPTDAELKAALCLALEIDNLNEYVVDRGETVLNVRPSANYA